ncbi:uncharacterized protein BJX67DRAFT_334147 [Aspergillus lucknowensis]|uniref:Uncharacterized protein n=1 Tax=Aspergillus lucknowensis TaxID=176173 RepID=A0ABR4LB04_9EURO
MTIAARSLSFSFPLFFLSFEFRSRPYYRLLLPVAAIIALVLRSNHFGPRINPSRPACDSFSPQRHLHSAPLLVAAHFSLLDAVQTSSHPFSRCLNRPPDCLTFSSPRTFPPGSENLPFILRSANRCTSLVSETLRDTGLGSPAEAW